MKRNLKYDTSLRVICALLFATFSFLYIYMLQGELLALVQDHLSQGKTSNNTLITASIITLLLLLLQFLLNRMGQLHGKFEALSYLPSCVLLASITKIDATFSYSLSGWVVTVVVVAIVYVLSVWINRNTLQLRDVSFFSQLSPNLGVLALLFLFAGWYGNNAPAEQMELTAWKHIHSRQYDKVLEVGKRSDDCNAGLTALRNLALAKTGQLGDKLFAYPQPYGSAGLMMNRYNVQTPLYGAKEFYSTLGATPYGGEDAEAFYKRMYLKTDSAIYRDMYLSALLLDKDLPTFVAQTIGGDKSSASSVDAPEYYQEAWIIYNEQHPFTPVSFTPSEAVKKRYDDYLSLRREYAGAPIVMQNLCKRRLGDTYWYYYDFVE